MTTALQIEVTVIGLGPMGRALTGALLDAGHDVTVWNRTAARAAPVLDRGARWAATPAEAVHGAEVTLINVVDNTAADGIIAAAGDSVAGSTIVGLASDTPDRAQRTGQRVSAAGGRYLDGAIMTPVETIGTPAASILFAGPGDVFEHHRNVFDALGTSTWLGENPTLAAGYDMALLDLFWSAMAGYLHAVELAKAAGITPTKFLPHALGIVDILPAIFSDAAERVEADRHGDPTSALASIATSVDHLVAASAAAGLDNSALRALGQHVEAAIRAGHGGDEVSRISHRLGGSHHSASGATIPRSKA
jgi:3-hydroxyisobutyrate dehydrogenase-like beta-hydroxyacid dehydrogenase